MLQSGSDERQSEDCVEASTCTTSTTRQGRTQDLLDQGEEEHLPTHRQRDDGGHGTDGPAEAIRSYTHGMQGMVSDSWAQASEAGTM